MPRLHALSGRRLALGAALLAAGSFALAGCGGKAKPAETAPPPAASTPSRPPAPALPPLGQDAARARREVAGIRQKGLLLGNPKAPVTIIEYAALTCRDCAAIHRSIVPQVIARYVRTGEASLEYRATVNSTRSLGIAVSAYATSPQRAGWDFIQLVYLRATAPAGVPAETSPRLVAALGLDVPRWRKDLRNPQWVIEVKGALSVVRVAKFTGDPVFLIRRSGEQKFVVLAQPASFAQFAAAVAKARRQ